MLAEELLSKSNFGSISDDSKVLPSQSERVAWIREKQRQLMIELYIEHLTEEQLEAQRAFYQSPLGQGICNAHQKINSDFNKRLPELISTQGTIDPSRKGQDSLNQYKSEYRWHFLMGSIINWTMLFNLGLFALATAVLFFVSPSTYTGMILVGAVLMLSTRVIQPFFQRVSIESSISMDNAERKARHTRHTTLTFFWASVSIVGGLISGVGMLFFAVSL